MSRLVEADECERCGDPVDALRRLCPECTRDSQRARGAAMIVEADRDDRDLEVELASPEAGQVGIPVDAVCVGCGRTRVKRTSLERWASTRRSI